MTTQEQETDQPLQLPMAPNRILLAAHTELERLMPFVAGLTEEDWAKRSAVEEWRVGDVVAHLNLALAGYSRLLTALSAGKGTGNFMKTVGDISKVVAPAATPAISALNSAIPRLMDVTLSRDALKKQFAGNANKLDQALQGIKATDYSRPVHWMGATWPLSFFLASVTNELAVHGWDMITTRDPQARLDEEARAVLPWFLWSGTALMLRPPRQASGTIQVLLADPEAEMWWTLSSTGSKQGLGKSDNPDVTISGNAGSFVLTIEGRISPLNALRFAMFEITGNEDLARTFLGAWQII